ncbi:Uncharacterised protein [Serratia fonticola]|uniref:Uncharacterized protein n=1 Tax=Serratia fonticola TaxID=47917 RepID=A0A4U9W9T9_SERFO|nr:Uncharacterised protein [Serratia fonticola]
MSFVNLAPILLLTGVPKMWLSESSKQPVGSVLIELSMSTLVSNLNTDVTCLKKSGVISAYATEEPSAQLHIPFLETMFGRFCLSFCICLYHAGRSTKRSHP